MHPKLQKLADIEGLSIEELLEQNAFDSVVPGICTNHDCDYTTDVEPDQTQGWCEECNQGTVKSVLILAEIL